MNVRLEPVTRDNWEEVIKIDLAPEQWANVDPPSVLHALCEGQFWPTLHSYAIMNGDTMVGFINYGLGASGKSWVVAILIIDKHHQRKGYGRAAMERVIERARAEASAGASLLISYRPNNVAAERLYTSLGFKPEGELEGDVLAWLRF